MKFPLLTVVSIIIIVAACHRPRLSTSAKNIPDRQTAGLLPDSGYILKPQGYALLLKGNFEGIYNDTITLDYLNRFKDTDTIGKYYRMENGNLFACINDIIYAGNGAGHLLAELTPEKKLISSEYYSNGMYLCCWNNMYDGFRKQGLYYVLDYCGTGSGHCSTDSYFMEGPGDANGVNITTHIWTSMCTGDKSGMLACSLTSAPEFKKDTILMHYTLQHIKLKRNDRYKIKKHRKI